MATRADVEHMASTIATASDQAKQQVGALMSRLAGQPATVVRDALLDAFPTLLAGFENVGVAVGLEFYDSMRARTHGLPAYTATAVANPTPTADAVGIARAAARHLFNTDLAPEEAAERTGRELSDALGTRTKNAMRQTIKNNAVRDPANVTYARVPRGAKTCAFCTMLASRGFVYATAKTAGEEDKYHHDCDCMIVPSWDAKQAKLKGYDPADYSDQYFQARAKLESQGVKKPGPNLIAAQMRAMFPDKYTDGATGNSVGRPRSATDRTLRVNGSGRSADMGGADGTVSLKLYDKYRGIIDGVYTEHEQKQGFKVPPSEPTELPRKWDVDSIVFNAKAFNHALYGNFTGGGHLHGYGWVYDKPEFPKDWTPDDVYNAAHSALTGGSDHIVGTSYYITHKGLRVKVVVSGGTKSRKVTTICPATDEPED